MVGLAGGWPSWKTPGAKAVLALSPYTEPVLVHGTLGAVSGPVMYQGGTLDFVDFARAAHLAWTDLAGPLTTTSSCTPSRFSITTCSARRLRRR